MKKKLFFLIFLVVFSILGSKAFIALFSYQIIEKIKQDNQQNVALTYEWISSDFNGILSIHDVVITPYALKRTFYFEKINLHYTAYIDLLLNLSFLKSGNFSGLNEVEIPDVRIPLKGRDLDEWVAMEYGVAWLKPLGLYACGQKDRVDHEILQSMGVDELHASLSLKRKVLSSNLDAFDLSLNMFQLGKLDIHSEWLSDGFPVQLSGLDLNELQLQSLSLTHQEGGYFRRLSNYCSGLSGITREDYSRLAAQSWQVAMFDIGVLSDSVVQNLYHDYLLQGGKLKVQMNLPGPFKVDTYSSLFDQNLVERFGLTAFLNNQAVTGMSLVLSGKHFRPPAPVVVKPVEEVIIKAPFKAYRVTTYDDLVHFMDGRIKVKMKDGKAYEGILKNTNEYRLNISQQLGVGIIDYELKPHQVEVIEVWRTEDIIKNVVLDDKVDEK